MSHNVKARQWRKSTEALAASMDSLLGRKVRVTVNWGDDPYTFTGTVTRINRTPSSVFGKSLSVKPDDTTEARCGSMSGISPQYVEVLS